MRKQNLIKRKRLPEIFLFLVIAVLGVIYVRYTWIRIENEQIGNTIQTARSIERMLPKEVLKALDAKPGDIDKPQYHVIKNTLKAIIRVNNKARFAYLYTLRNGKLYFFADSEPEASKDLSPPGQEYAEADAAYYQPFKDGKEFVTGSLTDRWGTWISVLIPLKDEATGKTIAVFAMDFNAKSWDNVLLFEVFQSSLVIVLLLLAFLFSFNIKAKNRSLNYEISGRKKVEETLRESEEKYRLIFEYSPVGILSFDENGVIVACNDNFVKIIGSSREVLIGLNMLHLPDKKMVSSVQKALNGSTGLYEDVYQSLTAKKTTPVRALFAPTDVRNERVHGGVGIIEDITERKRSKEELEESREKYRGLFEAAFEAIFISEKGLCIEQNQRAEKIFGYTSEEAIGRYGTDWIVPEDREMVMNNMLTGYEEAYEATALKKDGTTFPCILQGKMMYYKGRKVRVTSLTDITGRKQVEAELSQSRERARQQRNAIARVAEDEVISFGDLKGSFQRLTEEAAVAIGVERASVWLLSDDKTILRCISLFEFRAKKHSSGAILNYADHPRYFEAINNESRINAGDAQNDPRTSEFTEGYLIPIGISSMLDAGIYIEGDLKGVVCFEHTGEKRIWYSDEESFASTMASIVAQTIANNKRKQTEEALRISEDKYRTMIEYSNDLIWMLDNDGCFTFFNEITAKTTGLKLNEWKGKSFFPLIIAEDLPIIIDVFQQNLKGEACNYELRFKKPYESILTISVNTSPIYISGKIEGVVSFGRDITERKRTEEAIKEALVKAESGNRLKSAFMNNISHEIRTPLNGILGFSQLITEPDLTNEEKTHFFSLIKTSSNRLINTVTNYMDISLIASGNVEVKSKPIDHQEILYKLYEQFHPLCVDKNLELLLEISGKAEGFALHSDAELFRNSLTHLLDNAVKFTQKGEITFGYFIEPDEMRFFVKDTGTGISKEAHDRIFENFVQEEVSLTRGYEGSGLGLSIARGFIRLLGGDIRVESEKGKGSVFTFNLPLGTQRTGIAELKEEESKVPFIEKPVILVAEDDETNLLFLEVILRRMNIGVIKVSNGQEGVEQCRNHPEISLVLMDLKMPVMDGFKTTREIRSFRKDLPVIAITAYAMDDDKKKAREAGCDDYLSKPVSRKDLLEKLKKYGIIN